MSAWAWASYNAAPPVVDRVGDIHQHNLPTEPNGPCYGR